MSTGTVLVVLFTGFLILFINLALLRKGKIPVKFTLMWFFMAVILILVGLVPQIIGFISNWLGFVTMSNMLVGILIILIIFMCIALTVIVSGQKEKIVLLTQEVSLLKQKIEEKEKRNG